MKEKINEVLVVEGKNDAIRLREIYEAEIVITGGLACPQSMIDLLAAISKNRDIIVFTDPDSPGNRIRHKILQQIPGAKQAFIAKKDALGRNKVGVEHAKDEVIKEALSNLVSGDTGEESLSYDDYLSLGLSGEPDSGKKREKVAAELKIGYGNGKTFYHWLNLVKATREDLERILNDAQRQ